MQRYPLAILSLAALILAMLPGPAWAQATPADSASPALSFSLLWESDGGPDPLDLPYGMDVDPDGNLWVADSENDRFQIIAPDGTFRDTWGASGSGGGEFEFLSEASPFDRPYGDIAFDSDGNLYIADTGNARIQKFSPDRAFVSSWGDEGEGEGQFLVPISIAVSEDGVVYVCDEVRNDVQMFDVDGDYLGAFGGSGSAEGQLRTPSGVAIDRAGDVWIADWSNDRIQRFSADGEWLAAWGMRGSYEGGLTGPNDVVIDEQGRVYVADALNNRLQVFTADGQFLGAVGSAGAGPEEFHYALGLALGDGVVYVSDRQRVQAFRVEDSETGAGSSSATPTSSSADRAAPFTLEWLWESTGGPDPLNSPYGMGIDPQGNLWVADGFNGRFQILAPDGTFIETWGTPGSDEGQFDFKTTFMGSSTGYGDVAFDTTGNIYVADTGNRRVQKFGPDRSFLRAWGSEGAGDGQFLAPSSIAIDAEGAVYVGDEKRDDVQRFDAEGRFLGTIGRSGRDEGEFGIPSGVAIDGQGTLWVTDWSLHRLQQFSPNGELLAVWGTLGSRDGQFTNPNDVVVDAAGRVYVWDDHNYRIQVFTPDGQFLAKVGGIGTKPGQFLSGAGLALGPDGTLYVSDMARNDVQAFRLVPPDDAP